MSSRESIKVIADILAHEMGLASGQIMLTNQRYNIPATNGLYVALSYVSGKAIASNNYAVSNGPNPSDGMTEHQEMVMLYDVQIDMMSFNDDARTRKEELWLALRSIYSQQQQEINGVRIGPMPPGFLDASSLEETKYLNRYTTMIRVQALVAKTKAVPDYYADFSAPEVQVNE